MLNVVYVGMCVAPWKPNRKMVWVGPTAEQWQRLGEQLLFLSSYQRPCQQTSCQETSHSSFWAFRNMQVYEELPHPNCMLIWGIGSGV